METAERLKNIVASYLKIDVDEISDDGRFIDDLGADSLDVVELVMAFEDEFDVRIPDDMAEKILTIRDMRAHIPNIGIRA